MNILCRRSTYCITCCAAQTDETRTRRPGQLFFFSVLVSHLCSHLDGSRTPRGRYHNLTNEPRRKRNFKKATTTRRFYRAVVLAAAYRRAHAARVHSPIERSRARPSLRLSLSLSHSPLSSNTMLSAVSSVSSARARFPAVARTFRSARARQVALHTRASSAEQARARPRAPPPSSRASFPFTRRDRSSSPRVSPRPTASRKATKKCPIVDRRSSLRVGAVVAKTRCRRCR